MKRNKLVLAIAIIIIIGLSYSLLVLRARKRFCPVLSKVAAGKAGDFEELIKEGYTLLKIRKDKDAGMVFEKAILMDSDDIDALWGKAEVLRRGRDFKQAESILNSILNRNPGHFPSLNSLSYTKYKTNDFGAALSLAEKVIAGCDTDKNNQAIAYMMRGIINSKLAQNSGLLKKLVYAGKIKGSLLKAKELAPDLAEVRVCLGTFYLLAPSVIGGNLDKAVEEFEAAFRIAPDFALVNVRLGQVYKKMGYTNKYKIFFSRAKMLDPQDDTLKEINEDY